MTVFLLLMTIYHTGFSKTGTGPTIIAVEFSSLEKCVSGANEIKKVRNDVMYDCVKIIK